MILKIMQKGGEGGLPNDRDAKRGKITPTAIVDAPGQKNNYEQKSIGKIAQSRRSINNQKCLRLSRKIVPAPQ
jgi:hypothetical protein